MIEETTDDAAVQRAMVLTPIFAQATLCYINVAIGGRLPAEPSQVERALELTNVFLKAMDEDPELAQKALMEYPFDQAKTTLLMARKALTMPPPEPPPKAALADWGELAQFAMKVPGQDKQLKAKLSLIAMCNLLKKHRGDFPRPHMVLLADGEDFVVGTCLFIKQADFVGLAELVEDDGFYSLKTVVERGAAHLGDRGAASLQSLLEKHPDAKITFCMFGPTVGG